MKKLLLTLAVAALAGGAARAQSAADLDTKYGFRDLKFETDTTAIEGLERVEATPLKLTAKRPADALKVGKATISSITYSFYQGKLYEVTLLTKGLVNSKALREALESQYGEGTPINAVSQDRDWNAKQVRLTYREDPAYHNGTIRFTHKKLNEQLQQAQKSVKKAAASDL
jgi:hypothetical protein